jgi:tetratricopeptide (TPR) repeat protein
VASRLEGAALSPRERSGLLDLLVPAGAEDVARTARERHLLVQRQIQRLGAQRPVVLWLDDLQWGLDSLDVVRHVLKTRLALPTPVLFVGVVRSDALRNRPASRERLGLLTADPAVSTIDLPPLGVDALGAMGRRLGLAPSLIGHLAERVAGNPRLFRAALDHWERAGRLVEARGGRVLRGPPEPVEPGLAEGFEAEVEQVLSGRPAAWVDALRVAAVLGTVVESPVWVAVCRALGHAATSDVPEVLARRGHAAPVGSLAWRFTHAGLREAVLASIPPDDRRRIQLAAAEALPLPGTPGEAARRGRHLAAAGRHEDAVTELLEAARRHLVSGDGLTAEVLLDFAEASAHEVGRSDAGLLAGLLRCRVWLEHQRLDEALALAERLREHADARSHVGRARVERVIGALLWELGRPTEARTQLALAAEEAARSGDGPVEVECTAAAGLLRLELGDVAGGHQTLLRAVARAERVGAPEWAMEAWLGLTSARVQQGHVAAALEALERASELASRMRDRRGLAQCALLRGEIELVAGATERAEAALRDAATRFDEIGSSAAARAWLRLGVLAATEGHWADAARRMRGLRARDWPPVSEAVRALAALIVVAAEPAAADAGTLFDEAAERIRRQPVAPREVAWVAAQIASRAGEGALSRRASKLVPSVRRQA